MVASRGSGIATLCLIFIRAGSRGGAKGAEKTVGRKGKTKTAEKTMGSLREGKELSLILLRAEGRGFHQEGAG